MLPDSKGEPGDRHDSHQGGSPAVAPPDAEESQGAKGEKGKGCHCDKGGKASAEMIEEVNRHPQLEAETPPEETPHSCTFPASLIP